MARIVISPTGVVNFPEGGGHFSVFLQYARGLQSLGCDICWLERLHGTGDDQQDLNLVTTFMRSIREAGLEGRVILYSKADPGPLKYLTVPQAQAESIFQTADLLLNFDYRLDVRLLSKFRRTALVDIDPGLLQFWISVGQISLPKHDYYFTTGETVGRSPLTPSCGIPWRYIRPPVCLDLWAYTCNPSLNTFTTVSSWWGGHGKGEWVTDGEDHVYENNKRVSFLQFAELPRACGESIELALSMGNGDPYKRKHMLPPDWQSKKPCPEDLTDYQGDDSDRAVLEHHGWKIRIAAEATGSPELYQAYILGSRGEFSCAKPSCIRLQNAWVSDRSICYLASGKPVVVQNTGPSSFLPDGKGMFRFITIQEAVEAFAKIRENYRRHSRAAREIAETYFDARTSLEGVLNCALGYEMKTACA